jgi:nucleoside-diphosphate-sugar epimerase
VASKHSRPLTCLHGSGLNDEAWEVSGPLLGGRDSKVRGFLPHRYRVSLSVWGSPDLYRERSMYAQVVARPGPAPTIAVVTGASGYVGVNLVQHLRHSGWLVRTVGRRPLGGADHTSADIRDRDKLRPVLEGATIVFHLAAKITLSRVDPEAWDINVRGPAAVAASALDAGVQRMVHCSSVHAFDLARSRPVLSENSPRATSPDRPIYDRSKAAGELEVRRVVEAGLDATIVNPTGVIGPVDKGPSRMNTIINLAARGRLPVVVQGGFDWVDVRDVVAGLVAAAERGRTGENYLLPGHRTTVLELGRLAAALNGHRGPILAIPGKLAMWVAPAAEWIGHRFHSDFLTPASVGTLLDDPIVDGKKAATELSYQPRPLEDTVRDLLRSFEGNPKL